jgi:hypothetical protein
VQVFETNIVIVNIKRIALQDTVNYIKVQAVFSRILNEKFLANCLKTSQINNKNVLTFCIFYSSIAFFSCPPQHCNPWITSHLIRKQPAASSKVMRHHNWMSFINSLFPFFFSNLSSCSITLMKDFQPFNLSRFEKLRIIIWCSKAQSERDLSLVNLIMFPSLLGILILKVFSCKLNMKFI